MKTVWIYVDTRYLPGHPDYIKVFANPVAADEWCKENDSEGVAFEYEVLRMKPGSDAQRRTRRREPAGL